VVRFDKWCASHERGVLLKNTSAYGKYSAACTEQDSDGSKGHINFCCGYAANRFDPLTLYILVAKLLSGK